MTIPTRKGHKGFSIVEMLVATACLGILLGASVVVTQNSLRREEGLTVILAVAGWLEEIQRNALRLHRPCTVTFETTKKVWTSRNPGEPIASVEPANCAIDSTLLLPRTGFSQAAASPDRKPFAIYIDHGEGSWNGPQLVFTQHGSVPITTRYVFAVKSQINDAKFTLRCLRVTQIAGMIGVGKIKTNESVDMCKAESFDDTI